MAAPVPVPVADWPPAPDGVPEDDEDDAPEPDADPLAELAPPLPDDDPPPGELIEVEGDEGLEGELGPGDCPPLPGIAGTAEFEPGASGGGGVPWAGTWFDVSDARGTDGAEFGVADAGLDCRRNPPKGDGVRLGGDVGPGDGAVNGVMASLGGVHRVNAGISEDFAKTVAVFTAFCDRT